MTQDIKLQHLEDELKKVRFKLNSYKTDMEEREMEFKKRISELRTENACKDIEIDNLKKEIDDLRKNN
jgi:SMC interacting uncharacterized protein involved in chromosome segregation